MAQLTQVTPPKADASIRTLRRLRYIMHNRTKRIHLLVSLLFILSTLLTPFPFGISSQGAGTAIAAAPSPDNLQTGPQALTSSTANPSETSVPTTLPTYTQSTQPTPSVQPTTQPTQDTILTTVSATTTSTSTGTITPIVPPPTYTISIPTAPPALTPIPDTNYVEQAIEEERDNLLDRVNSLPLVTGTAVSGQSGGRISSPDGGITLGIMPGAVPATETLNVRVSSPTFVSGDPRATHNGYPLAYTYELTATKSSNGQQVEQFDEDVVLVWNLNPGTLAAAGVKGFPYKVFTYDEQRGAWQEILSRWNPQTGQLVATTSHFSLYAVGDGFDEVNNYVPTINDFEVDLQSGTASMNYGLDLPPGPGGLGPRVSLSYNSGSVDRVDVTQQGPSSIGWGWTLSTNYIAATQHHFVQDATPAPSQTPDPGYHPWTASIVVDGINGDLVKGTDGFWHTSMESFARIEYTGTNRTNDKWTVWDKSGTKYVFDKNALKHDEDNSPSPTTYKWMLSTVTDVHSNTITYTYKYENSAGTIFTNTIGSPNTTLAVYPYQIQYGTNDGSNSKILVEFHLAEESPGNLDEREDIGDDPNRGDIYQHYYIDKVTVQRLRQGPPATYEMLRSYKFVQNYDIKLAEPTRPAVTGTATTTPTVYQHLTLQKIVRTGITTTASITTSIPDTVFEYVLASAPGLPDGYCRINGPSVYDVGHLCWARNGYGGSVGFYYDAAGGDVNQAYRRVRAKRIHDGMGTEPPHLVTYHYEHKGAITNLRQVSGDAGNAYPLHLANSEFRGFAAVHVQSPLQQADTGSGLPSVFHSTYHYYSQSDGLKGTEWRVQEGKETVYTDTMATVPPTNGYWDSVGTPTTTADPQNSSNTVWKLNPGTTAVPNYVERKNYLGQGSGDGYDVALRFMVAGGVSTEHACRLVGNWKLRNAEGEYFGLRVKEKQNTSNEGQCEAEVVWGAFIGDTFFEGTRDLSDISNTLTPRRLNEIKLNVWYTLKLHTSPDGRFALQLYQAFGGYGASKDYILIRSGDSAIIDGQLGQIPSFTFTTLQTWKFKHDVATSVADPYYTLLDDYSETRTVYSQVDSIHSVPTIAAPTFTPQPLVGMANNTRSMSIRFNSLAQSSSTIFGYLCCQPTQIKRTKTAYAYDGYGNQTEVKEYGDLDTSDDDRTTVSTYAVISSTNTYIVGKPASVSTYQGISGASSPVLMAYNQNYYDNQTSPGVISSGGKGLLTQAERVSVVSGVISTSHVITQQFSYDTYGNTEVVRDPRGNSTITQYDTYYHTFPITTTYPNGGSEIATYNFSAGYNLTTMPLDALTSKTDMNGTRTEYRTDVFGRPLKRWISTNNIGTEEHPNELFLFQDLGVVGTMTAPVFISHTVRLGTEVGTNEYTWQMRWYDGRGRVLQDVSPKDLTSNVAVIVSNTYSDTGQLESTTIPYTVTLTNPLSYTLPLITTPRTTFHYDGIGRPDFVRNPDNTYRITDYNWMQWVGTYDESGHYKWQRTDPMGRLARVKEQDMTLPGQPSTYTDYEYDALNNLKEIIRDTDGSLRFSSTILYDGFGRKKEMTDPDMGKWQYEYDAASNLIEQRDALYLTNTTTYASHRLFFTYDEMNRIKLKYYGQAHKNAGIPDVKYYYDNDLEDASTAKSWGRLRMAEVTVQGQGTAKANKHWYSYDARGLVAADVVTTTYTTNVYTVPYTYDTGGRLSTLTYPNPTGSGGEVVKVMYNQQGMGLPDQLFVVGGSDPYPVSSATYNERGQLDVLVQGTAGNALLTTDYSYNVRGWMQGMVVTTANATLLNLGIEFEGNGNIRTIRNSGVTSPGSTNPEFTNSFQYDGLDRLINATSVISNPSTLNALFPGERYTFDSLDRMTTRSFTETAGVNTYTYSYGDTTHKHAPTSYKGNAYAYDANGNQTVRVVNGVTQTLTYDAENRVERIVEGGTTSEFVYDASGKRIIKSVTTPTPTPVQENVSWTNLVNTIASGSDIEKTSGGSDWNAGGSSSKAIPWGDGSVEAVASIGTDSRTAFGLSSGDASTDPGEIDFAFYLRAPTIYIWEEGQNIGSFGSFTSGDTFKVAIVAGVVKYYHNNTLLYTSTVTPQYPLLVDASFMGEGDTLEDVTITGSNLYDVSSAPPTIIKRTLYIGNLYEEELIGANHPHTIYYYLGAKMVAMKRVNYATGNGQYRMVGDHLGSTTLIVNSASTPSVVHRQYHKPYGEVAWESPQGGSLTTFGYTGQRLDKESGLMYYGARYYDPVLAHFVSADPTVPDVSNPIDMHRYLYTRSNPLRYNDPSGYGPNDHYVFVYGCVTNQQSQSGGCEDDNRQSFGDFTKILEEEYNRGGWGYVSDEVYEERLLRGKPGWIPYHEWARTHVHGVGAPSATSGARNLDDTLAGIGGNGNIHIWGHSAGAGAVLQYLVDKNSGLGLNSSRRPIDSRIRSIALIDGDLDGVISQAEIYGVNIDRMGGWLAARTRITGPGDLLQVRVKNSILYSRCVGGFTCMEGNYSDPRRTDDDNIGPVGPSIPILVYGDANRLAWHGFTYHAALYTNYESFFRRLWGE
jgi:RHS repeat-associated protein